MVYGVLLIYYDKYAIRAIHEFKLLLDKLDCNYEITLVCNSPGLKNNLPQNSNFKIVDGDNSSWEFSGWDRGIIKDDLHDNDVIIFANDTFCHHNYWGKYEKFLFEKQFAKLIKKNSSKPFSAISGNVDTFGENFSLEGCSTSGWVSTYLFLVTATLLKQLDNKVTTRKLINYDEINDDLIWDESISENLKKHINNWMFLNTDAQSGWYKKDDVDLIYKSKKIQSILNEKDLSASCNENGGIIYDVKDINILRKIRNFFR